MLKARRIVYYKQLIDIRFDGANIITLSDK